MEKQGKQDALIIVGVINAWGYKTRLREEFCMPAYEIASICSDFYGGQSKNTPGKEREGVGEGVQSSQSFSPAPCWASSWYDVAVLPARLSTLSVGS